MLARLLYGGGLALVAAQLLGQGHVCGPGCSGAADGNSDGAGYQDSARMPPGLSQSYRGQPPPSYSPNYWQNYSQDRRSMMRSADQSFAQQRLMDQRGMDYRQHTSDQDQGRGYQGHGHHHQGPGNWRDQASRPQSNFNRSPAYEIPRRDSGSRSMQTPLQPMPLQGNEDFRTMPQPSLQPKMGGYRGANPMPMTRQQFRSMRPPTTRPAPPVDAWNI